MNFELISEEEFNNLPEDDEQCFVEFETICRRNMTRMISDDTSGNFDRAVQAQYVAAVSAVAAECGITNIPEPHLTDDSHFYPAFSAFNLAVQGEVARIRIRGERAKNSLSVQLTDNTRTKIQHYVFRLRETIDKADIASDRKKALHAKLNELVEELEKPRLNLGKTAAAVSVVLAGLSAAANMTTIAAEGQGAVAHIMRLIGVDKESEDAAVSRLAPPPKALPSPPDTSRNNRANIRNVVRTSGLSLDDEIPF